MRRLLLVSGVALLVVLLWRLGPSKILDALSHIGWSFVPILLLGAAHHAVRAVALRLCVLRPDRLRYTNALALRLAGESVQSLTFTGPVLSQPTTAWLFEGYGFTLQEGFAATLTEYIAYALVTATVSMVGLVYFAARFAPAAAVRGAVIGMASLCAIFLAASAVAIARRFYLIGGIIDRLARIGLLRGRLQPDMAWINGMEDLLLAILRGAPLRFATILVLEVVAQACLLAELFWLMWALDIRTPVLFPFVIEASLKGIEIAFLFIPLQVGVAEGAYAVVLGTMGLPAAAGFALAFVRRARSIVMAGLGLIALGAATRHRHGGQETGSGNTV